MRGEAQPGHPVSQPPAAHVPVLYTQVLDGLQVIENGTYLDGTFGRGGHARGVLQHLGPGGRLLVMDKDPEGDRGRRTSVRWRCARVHPSRQLCRSGPGGRCGNRRRHPAGSGRVLAAAGCGRARFQFRQGRPAGHAHGPRCRAERGRVAGPRQRPRDRRCAVDLWRRTPEPPHRTCHPGAPHRAAAAAHRAVGRPDRLGDAARRQQDPSGYAQFSGDPHLHQPRTGRSGSRTGRRPGRACRAAVWR